MYAGNNEQQRNSCIKFHAYNSFLIRTIERQILFSEIHFDIHSSDTYMKHETHT
jgi:hypothetical protein